MESGPPSWHGLHGLYVQLSRSNSLHLLHLLSKRDTLVCHRVKNTLCATIALTDGKEGRSRGFHSCGQTITMSVQTGQFQGLGTVKGSILATYLSQQPLRTASFGGLRLCYTLMRTQKNETAVQGSWGAPGFAEKREAVAGLDGVKAAVYPPLMFTVFL